MKQLIMDEINQINNLEERVAFKELMNGVFLSLYENNLEMYERLEKRVFDEIAYDSNQYSIVTGLIERRYFDLSHHMFSPMLQKDMEDEVYDLEQILRAMQNKEEIKVMQVFLECDYLKVEEILGLKRTFSGYIKTEKGSYRTEFCVKKNEEYQEEINHLYQLFIKNGIPWKTVNCPYISKIVDVFIQHCDADLTEDETIEEISVDFQEYSKYINYKLVPVWNVMKKNVNSVGFPIPCEDHKNYEHAIPIEEYGLNNAFLVESYELSLEYIQKQEGKMVITCGTDDIRSWDIYIIRDRSNKKIDQYSYPILSNFKKNSFAEKLYQKNQVIIKTQAELIRFIENFDLEDYLVFDYYEITDRKKVNLEETYSMNSFIIDEIRDCESRKRLIVWMKPINKDFFLTRDILSFIVSEVQIIYPEYYCEGKLS